MRWATVKRRPTRERGPYPRLPLLALSLAGLVAVSVIGALLLLHLRVAGIEHEQREAERQATIVGRVVVAPMITPKLIRGDSAALARFDRALRQELVVEPIVRVKLWTSDGRIVYSDERRLIGHRFALGDDERAVLATGGAVSELSDHDRPENRFEHDDEQLLEVYTQVRSPAGDAMLFEVYKRFDSITRDRRELWTGMLPALLGGLALLQLVNLSILRWFSRRERRAERRHAASIARALDAANQERRAIAANLHDTVIQDLTAVSLAVAAVARTLDPESGNERAASELEDAAEMVRASVGSLRTLLMDLYPADLAARGLGAALGDLVNLARTRGLTAALDVAPDLRPPLPSAGVLFRVAQEATRNVLSHSGARSMSIRAGADRHVFWVEVRDDGSGFDPEEPSALGHFGLRAAQDLMRDAGGRLVVHSTPGEGSVVRAELPAPSALRDPHRSSRKSTLLQRLG